MDNTYFSYVPEAPDNIGASFFKSISFLAVFLILTPITLSVSVFSLVYLSYRSLPDVDTREPLVANTQSVKGLNIFAALPDTIPSIKSTVGYEDARVEIVKKYLKNYNSPLEPHAGYIVEMADENGLDFRLLTAIAQQESNLCKKIPENSFNCWGWGIHSRGTLGFSSFEEGIRVVSEGLKRDYINKGYTTPEEIMSKYTPLSNGSWAFGVNTFLGEMR